MAQRIGTRKKKKVRWMRKEVVPVEAWLKRKFVESYERYNAALPSFSCRLNASQRFEYIRFIQNALNNFSPSFFSQCQLPRSRQYFACGVFSLAPPSIHFRSFHKPGNEGEAIFNFFPPNNDALNSDEEFVRRWDIEWQVSSVLEKRGKNYCSLWNKLIPMMSEFLTTMLYKQLKFSL